MSENAGKIEFTRPEGKPGSVFNPMSGRIIDFDNKTWKYYTSDPNEIKILDSLGYQRGFVVIDGKNIDVENLSLEELEKVKKAIEIREKAFKPEDVKIVDIIEDAPEAFEEAIQAKDEILGSVGTSQAQEESKEAQVKQVEQAEQVSDQVEQAEIAEKTAEEETKKRGRKKLSSKLASELGD